MRRILALVCIFILLLFTGLPMFTSNLLCNETRVYAHETPNISDNEKIRAAITVFLNSKGAYLSSNGLQMDTVMNLMQEHINRYYPAYSLILGSLYDDTKLLLDIGITTSPLTVVLKAGAVSFFNYVLQQMINDGTITSGSSGSDGLYSGYVCGGGLVYKFNYSDVVNSGSLKYVPMNKVVQTGTAVSGGDFQTLYNAYKSSNPNIDFNLQQNQSNQSVNVTLHYASNRVLNKTLYFTYAGGQSDYQPYTPCIYMSDVAKIIYSSRLYKVQGCAAWYTLYASSQTFYAGVVTTDYTNKRLIISEYDTYNRNDLPALPASVDFNKDNFDPSPTTPPSGSDGLTYQPRQSGTGNTYNTYNDYYNDWHEGDTYIYYPSDGGGGNDPGGGGEDPTPGGTTPPWNGSGSDGLYSQGGTLTPDGNGGYNLNLPDVGLPDLNIDWSINGLKEKFPFSIPWDLMAFFAVMNAEPETPEIQATIPLGLWEWDIDWDLHAFDNVARILRNMELIGFCIGLILITRSIIKG